MKKQRNTHHHIQNITLSHHRIRQHHLITHHLPQQTPKNPKRSLENNYWLHPRHQYLHSETKILSNFQYRNSYKKPLTPLTTQEAHPRYKKQSTFNNNINYTLNIPSSTQTTSHTQIKNNMKTIHTKIVHGYISSTHNKILSRQPPPIHESETTLDHRTRPTQIKQITFHPLIPQQNFTLISSFTFMPTLPNTPSRHPSPLHLHQNKYHTGPRESVDRPRESG